jgi:hypothetical protein
MKSKRYTSGDKLGKAWLAKEIKTLSHAGRYGSYKIIADADTIWNGEKTQILARRNRKLNLVIALRRGTTSLGKSALSCILHATEIPAVYKWDYRNNQSVRTCVSERQVPTPVVFMNNLDNEALSSCDSATLQPIVLASCTEHLKSLLRGYRQYKPGDWRYEHNDDQWEKEVQVLKAVGLEVPKELLDKKIVAIATRRLRTNTHHI